MSLDDDDRRPLTERAKAYAGKLIDEHWDISSKPRSIADAASRSLIALRETLIYLGSLAYLHGYAAGVEEAGRPLRRKK